MEYICEDGDRKPKLVITEQASTSWTKMGLCFEYEETLYRTAEGRFYLAYSNVLNRSEGWAYFVSRGEAAEWLSMNRFELPKELRRVAARLQREQEECLAACERGAVKVRRRKT